MGKQIDKELQEAYTNRTFEIIKETQLFFKHNCDVTFQDVLIAKILVKMETIEDRLDEIEESLK